MSKFWMHKYVSSQILIFEGDCSICTFEGMGEPLLDPIPVWPALAHLAVLICCTFWLDVWILEGLNFNFFCGICACSSSSLKELNYLSGPFSPNISERICFFLFSKWFMLYRSLTPKCFLLSLFKYWCILSKSFYLYWECWIDMSETEASGLWPFSRSLTKICLLNLICRSYWLCPSSNWWCRLLCGCPTLLSPSLRSACSVVVFGARLPPSESSLSAVLLLSSCFPSPL